jgi:hypothetical protein
MPYSGKHDFVTTEMYLPVNHMVSDASEAVSCKECHTPQNGRLAALNDFYMPGRDRNEMLDFAGRMLLILSLIGVAVHAIIRILSARKRNLAQTR